MKDPRLVSLVLFIIFKAILQLSEAQSTPTKTKMKMHWWLPVFETGTTRPSL